MRILLIAHGFPPTHYAGAERRAERMARWLVQNGHYVEVFALEDVEASQPRLEVSEQNGFIVHRLYYNLYKDEDYFHYFENLYNHPAIGKMLRALIAQHQFDLAHIVSGYLLGAEALHAVHDLGLPMVITLTEYWFMCARLNLVQATDQLCSGPETPQKCARCLMERRRRYLIPARAMPGLMDALWPMAHPLLSTEMVRAVIRRQTTLKDALNLADVVISPSQFLINKFAEFGYDTRRYHYLRQGLAHSDEHLPERQAGDGKTLRIGITGQLKPHKAIDLVVDAVAELLDRGEPITLDIWGGLQDAPDYVTSMQEKVAHHSAIRWRGAYKGNEVWDVLSQLDVLVISSRWYENSPNTILEAFKMGMPVVATNLGGMSELIEHEKSGLLFELNQTDDLRRQLQRLLYEPGLLDRLRENIPAVKTIDDEMTEIIDHYRELLASRS
jgi:glycosyltransferase involved in cell wall biosynthesis